MEDDLDLDALKAKALASIKRKNEAAAIREPRDELAALRAAALLSKAGGPDSAELKLSATEPTRSSSTSVSSKFDRGQSSDEGSDFSILEEIERGNIIESDQDASELADNEVGGADRAILDLLDDEFDDDEFLIEEAFVSSADVKQSKKSKVTEQSQVLDRRKERRRSTNGLTASSQDKTHDRQQVSPPPRHRSRSPRRRTSPQRRRNVTSPPSHRSPHKHSDTFNHTSRVVDRRRDDSSGGHRKSDTSSVRVRSGEIDREPVTDSPSVRDPLGNPLLTEEERETLRSRKNKFSDGKKLSETKKTISLNKTKKKVTVKKRLGTSTQSEKIVKRESPAIVETVALETGGISPLATPPPAAKKKKITDRLGGYVATDSNKEPATKKRRQVSIEEPIEEPDIASSESSNESFEFDSDEFSDTDSQGPGSNIKSSRTTKAPRSQVQHKLVEISPVKRNIWTSRAAEEYDDRIHTLHSSGREVIRGGRSVNDRIGSSMNDRIGSSMITADDELETRMSSNSSHVDARSVIPRKSAVSSSSYHSDELSENRRSRETTRSSTDSRGERGKGRRQDEKVHARPSHSDRAVSHREEHGTTSVTVPEGKGKSQKEKQLDERIRKIKEENAKREERQKEIEREKLLYG